ncbi:AI-2E family transporter [Weizmannia acidilactici]|uniref:AI-2E family transporter n=1 Tax=Weizmannia acidilactici TaxID=2607726 RepID=A0A5J4JIS4_9BACI|nr:AI-2E family transporter [Weizmannia acidilactici]GER65559.1 AI-2E family transporter [Weizmannia acidilactici]GER70430.1 AI-2E family transporter [Weizmannia acidilactici]GER74099.1 AI-2E family transporter [Weizmannia acidilactici]
MKEIRFSLLVKYILLAVIAVLCVKYFGTILKAIGNIWHVAFPLVLGAVIAYVLNILMKKIEHIYFPNSGNKMIRKTRRTAGILLSFLVIFGIVSILILIIVPQLVQAITVVINAIPEFYSKTVAYFQANSGQYSSIGKLISSLQVDLDSVTKKLTSSLSKMLTGILNSTFSIAGAFTSGVMNLIIAIIFAVYILASKEKLSAQADKVIRAFLKKKTSERIYYVLRVANDTFSSFIVGQCVEAVILGCLCTAGMFLLHFPYAAMVGAFISATALIPVVGAYLGAAFGAFMILTVNPMQALFFLIFIVVLQQVEGNIIYPRVVGSSIGLPGLWVLAAVIIGGGLGGVVGMLLGVPVAATLYKLAGDQVHKRLHSPQID